MATKSFTTEMSFDRKSIKKLMKTLENKRKPNIDKDVRAEFITDVDEIRRRFKRKDK